MEYDWRCNHCGDTVSTYSPAGETCECGLVSADWMRSNKATLERRYLIGNPQLVHRFHRSDAFKTTDVKEKT